MNYLNRIKNIYDRKAFPYTLQEKHKESIEVDFLYESRVLDNTIALIEPNSFHAECYPSYIKYFIDLGFNVHLFTTKRNENENSLVNCNFPVDKLKFFYFTKFPTCQRFFDYLLNYKYILFLTLLCQTNTYYGRVIMDNYILKYNKNNLFCINHEVYVHEENKKIEDFFLDYTFVLRDKIFKDSKEYPFISPIYFGEYKNIIKDKSKDKIKFLSVGGNWKENLRNYDELFSSIKSLIAQKIENFEVIFIGVKPENLIEYITPEIEPYIKTTNRLSFKDLYQYHYNCDFILFNIDKNTSAYEKYMYKGISGAYSMSIGFLRPGIIDKGLAVMYNLSDSRSVCYSFGNLTEAMKEAIELPNEKYINLQKNLKTLSDELQKRSRENLKEYFNA